MHLFGHERTPFFWGAATLDSASRGYGMIPAPANFAHL
jgi:hypothetical protein